MPQLRFFPNLHVRSSLRFASVNSHQGQLRRLAAGVALCSLIAAGTPAYGRGGIDGAASPGATPFESSPDSVTSHETLHFGTVIPDGQADLKGTISVGFKVKTLLGSGVVYNDKCREVTTGRWKVDSSPAYGTVATGLITGRLSTGACPGIKFTSAAIYYTWTKPTKATQDGFKATYLGYLQPVGVTYVLKLKPIK
jgi:hypothetical protein